MDLKRGKATVKKGWALDVSDYTEHQLEFLQFLGFPREINTNRVLQKRNLLRKNTTGGYTDREIQNYKTIVYSAISKNTAKAYVDRELNSIKALKGDPKRRATYDKIKYSQPYQCDYIGMDAKTLASDIEKELTWLFSEIYEAETVAATPTPSMVKAEVEQKEVKEDTVKGLSNVHKKKARELSEGGATSGEIATELNVDEQRVINYLKQL